ncbi:MAG: GNAT family N-acetyltransferase [Nitrospinota bacterium]|nr:MAG: GNAT family N-acetyltransferase [Nitrospinota bacterium]
MPVIIKNVDPRPIQRQLMTIYKRAYEGWEEYAYQSNRDIIDYLRWLRKRAPEGFLVAFMQEKPIGFIGVDYRWIDSRGEAIGEIHELALDPDFQAQGIGKQLFLAGLEVLRAKGHRRFGLWVGEKNTRAQALYTRFGFRIQERRGIWIRMVKEE